MDDSNYNSPFNAKCKELPIVVRRRAWEVDSTAFLDAIGDACRSCLAVPYLQSRQATPSVNYFKETAKSRLLTLQGK